MSIYAALMENGIGMRQIDEMDFGLYMDIISDRARRRGRKKEAAPAPAKGVDQNVIELRRGTIDEIFG